jgi:glutamate synthase (NADPH/NADH) small chain
VLVERIKLGEADSSGRKKPEPVPNSEFEMKADLVIKALGFYPENLPQLFNSPDLSISKFGTIKINLKTMETNLSGVFAAGDIVRGASLVVWAIRDGRDATMSIQKYLEHKQNKSVKAA